MSKRIITVLIAGLLLPGCATISQMDKVESASATNSRMLRENERRLHNVENSITALNSQVAQLNNRVYEVRTRSGQKTSLLAVPVSPSAPDAKAANIQNPAAYPKTQPTGKKIGPASAQGSLSTRGAVATARTPKAEPAIAGASGTIGAPSVVAAPSGQSAAQSSEFALPPTDIPPVGGASTNAGQSYRATAEPATRQVSGQGKSAAEVPVPPIPASDLSLPPEHPNAPTIPQGIGEAATAPAQTRGSQTVQAAQPAQPTQATQAPQSMPAPRQVAKTAAPGEEAAYNAALKAARSGNSAEGVRLFREFLQKYPSGRYAANADYWLGECLYSQGKYQEALSQFQTVNDTFPAHHKNADALFKAGVTLGKLGDKAGASAKFRTLIANFPNTEAARRARSLGN